MLYGHVFVMLSLKLLYQGSYQTRNLRRSFVSPEENGRSLDLNILHFFTSHLAENKEKFVHFGRLFLLSSRPVGYSPHTYHNKSIESDITIFGNTKNLEVPYAMLNTCYSLVLRLV